MILTCPGCSARYRVKDGLIPAAGKKVKCKKCSVVFRAYADGRCEDTAPSAPAESVQPPTQPAATATVRVDAEKIQALVMQQHSAGQEKRKPLPDVPENVVVQQKPPQTPSPEPQAAAPPEVEEPVEPRKSFTDFSEGISANQQNVPDQQDLFFGETEEGEADSSADEPQEAGLDASEAMDEGAFGRQQDPAQATDFQFDVPPEEDAGESALKSELDEFRFELPEDTDDDKDLEEAEADGLAQPQPEEPAFAAPTSDLPEDPFSQPAGESDGTDFALPEATDPFATAAMPVAGQDEAQPQLEESEDSQDQGFPEVETGQLESPAMPDMPEEGSPEPAAAEFPSSKTGAPETPDAAPRQVAQTYQAKIDGTTYPKLTEDVIERWIREGRLLESDHVAIEGSSDFKRADEYSQFGELFRRYFGQKAESAPTQEKKKKKGFFSRMFKK